MFYRDTIFSSPIEDISKWIFDEKVAKVFQDMVQRSIPGYFNILSMIGMLAKRIVQSDTQVYDLGCSLGAVTLSIYQSIHHLNYKIIAVDNSPAMIKFFRFHINDHKRIRIPIDIIEGDIRDIKIQNASMVVMNFTLQFLNVEDKQALLNKIYKGLNHKGVLVLSEKVDFKDSKMNDLLLNMHYDFKRAHGYSEFEILQKYNVLKDSMFINSVEIHKARLKKAGFVHIELWYQHFNFGSFIALKDEKKA